LISRVRGGCFSHSGISSQDTLKNQEESEYDDNKGSTCQKRYERTIQTGHQQGSGVISRIDENEYLLIRLKPMNNFFCLPAQGVR
jgi:hypothetical protein